MASIEIFRRTKGLGQNPDKKALQLVEDKAPVVAGGGQGRIDPVAGVPEEIVPAQPAVCLGMADHGLDRRSSSELALHRGGESAFLSREHGPGLALVIVATIALVGVGAFDCNGAHGFGLLQGCRQGVPIIWGAGESLGGQKQPLPVGGGDPDLAAELIALVGLAFGDAGHLWGMQAVELLLVLRLLGQEALDQTQETGEASLSLGVAGDLAADVSLDPPQIGAQALQLPAHALVLAGMGITSGHGCRLLGQPRVALA